MTPTIAPARAWLAAVAVAAAGLLPIAAASQALVTPDIPPAERTPPSDTDNRPDEVIVLNIGAEDLETLISEGYVVLEEQAVVGLSATMWRLRIPPEVALLDAWRRVRSLETGEISDFNHFYRGVQGSCLARQCPERALVGWHVAANREESCGRNIVIGMIDSGVNDLHETFRGAALSIKRLAPEELPPSRSAHGTAVAALLVGDPASRSPGLVPGAKLVAVDAFHVVDGDERSDLATIIEGLGHLADEQVSVINLSLAGPHNIVLEYVMEQLTSDLDIVVVAAVGNNGPNAKPAYPAGYGRVLAVTAVDRTGELYTQAIRGPHVDISAPGVEVWTAATIKGARWKTGTSFAAPFVTAAAAILREAHPELSVDEVAAELQNRARDLGAPGFDIAFGAGLLNLAPLCS